MRRSTARKFTMRSSRARSAFRACAAWKMPRGGRPQSSTVDWRAARAARNGALRSRVLPGHRASRRGVSQETNMSKPYLSCVIALLGLLSGALAAPLSTQGDLKGAAVVTPSDAPIGKVVDVVMDANNQPSFVVIDTGG